MAKGDRRRANPRKRPLTAKEKAPRMRLLLILLVVMVPVLVLLNWNRDPDQPGPLGVDPLTWLGASAVLYLVIGVVGVYVVWWLAKHDELPRER